MLESPSAFSPKGNLLGWSMGCHHLSDTGYSAVRPVRREGPRTAAEPMDTGWDCTDFIFRTGSATFH